MPRMIQKITLILTASCMVSTISGTSVATSAGASVAMATTFLAILRPNQQKFLKLAVGIAVPFTPLTWCSRK